MPEKKRLFDPSKKKKSSKKPPKTQNNTPEKTEKNEGDKKPRKKNTSLKLIKTQGEQIKVLEDRLQVLARAIGENAMYKEFVLRYKHHIEDLTRQYDNTRKPGKYDSPGYQQKREINQKIRGVLVVL